MNLEIALTIPASNEWKILTNNSAALGLIYKHEILNLMSQSFHLDGEGFPWYYICLRYVNDQVYVAQESQNLLRFGFAQKYGETKFQVDKIIFS